jgi:transcriptional regulator GlxA family with amidase domain
MARPNPKPMQGLNDGRSPLQIVEDADRYIRENLNTTLTVTTIAAAIGVTRTDVKDSYRYIIDSQISYEVRRIRLYAFYNLVRSTPNRSLGELAADVGLVYGKELEAVFQEWFWTTIEEARQNKGI